MLGLQAGREVAKLRRQVASVLAGVEQAGDHHEHWLGEHGVVDGVEAVVGGRGAPGEGAGGGPYVAGTEVGHDGANTKVVLLRDLLLDLPMCREAVHLGLQQVAREAAPFAGSPSLYLLRLPGNRQLGVAMGRTCALCQGLLAPGLPLVPDVLGVEELLGLLQLTEFQHELLELVVGQVEALVASTGAVSYTHLTLPTSDLV